jgi:hypothetical protein
LVSQTITALFAMIGARAGPVQSFHDANAVPPAILEDILRSISYIGPAMNPQRFADFRQQVEALTPAPIWARTFRLHAGYLRRAAS